MGEFGLALAGILGNYAGGKLAQGMMGGSSTAGLVDSVNHILNTHLQDALNYTSRYSGQAQGQINSSLANAINTLQNSNRNAQNILNYQGNLGMSNYNNMMRPYATMGANAADAYARSLGLPVVKGGSAQQLQYAQIAQKLAPLLHQLNGNYTKPVAPTAQGIAGQTIGNNDVMNYLRQNTVMPDFIGNAKYTGIMPTDVFIKPTIGGRTQQEGLDLLAADPVRSEQIKEYLSQNQYQNAMSQYQSNLGAYNQAASLLNGYESAPDQMAQIARNLKGLL